VINGIGLFMVAVVIGSSARIDVISVAIWDLLSVYPPHTGAALLLALGMLLVILALRIAQRYVVRSGRQATVGGRGIRVAPLRLGWIRVVTRILVSLYILAAAVAPVVGLLVVSLEHYWSPSIPWTHLTLVNFTEVFDSAQTYRALINSLVLAAAAATIVMLAAAFLMLYARQKDPASGRRIGTKKRRRDGEDNRKKQAIDLILTLPATVPPSVIAVSFILAFSGHPFNLYGSIWIILLAFVVMEIPYAASTASTATSVVGSELAEASRICGASERRTMLRILVPTALPGLAAGWVLVFIRAFGEVAAVALLSGSSNPVVGSVLLNLWQQGQFSQMTALAIVVWLISSGLVLLSLRLSRWQLARATH
jgi:iron(III) transport system permease protein